MQKYFAEVLRGHSDRVMKGPTLAMDVHRDGIFAQAIAFYKTATTDQPSRPFRIRFAGEEGVDASGLTREFFSEFFQMVTAPRRGLFEGPCSFRSCGLFTM